LLEAAKIFSLNQRRKFGFDCSLAGHGGEADRLEPGFQLF
jgi:hypothetical protein